MSAKIYTIAYRQRTYAKIKGQQYKKTTTVQQRIGGMQKYRTTTKGYYQK